MLSQDLSSALLLYDDINKKGFEGDLVINGFAEFIRNLLVCKDEKVAELLEVVESFKEKYIAASKKTSPSLLISTLNILNEAEINYKAARNKKLHTELAIIKLCYLQQAIELTAEPNGISKKKIIESAKPMAFRNIPPIEIKNYSSATIIPREAKLIIETSLVREEPSVYQQANQPQTTNPQPTTATTRLTALDKIRKQVKGNGQNGSGIAPVNKPIELENLQLMWNEFASLLKSEKNSAGTNFEMAELRIQDANSFFALVSNNIQLKFIEQAGQRASQFLREKMNNSLLEFYIVMEENKDVKIPADTPLTSRQQFLKLAEQYPMVKELKDRLRLELDY